MADETKDGSIQRTNIASAGVCPIPDGVSYTLSLPANTTEQAIDFLAGLGGDAVGAGQAMNRVGINAPIIRLRYKQEIEQLTAEIVRRLESGESREAIARWASEERRRIVYRQRAGAGAVGRSIYEIRDYRKYGWGGRTYDNIYSRYQKKGYTSGQIHDAIIERSQISSPKTNAAVRGASYLRHGGKVIIVVGVAVSAARIWNASDEDLPRVIGEELGGWVGGGIGAGAGVGACIVFGIATSGWGLLACGVVGGIGGGVAGSYAGGHIADGIYYSDTNTPAHLLGNVTIEIPNSQLYSSPPPNICLPPR